MDYSIVVPIYNEQGSIDRLYCRLRPVMEKLGGSFEIIFMDDGSTDGSFDILRELSNSDKNVKVISFTRNYGQHPAVIAGFEASSGELVITLDADLQNPPEEIPTLIKVVEGYDMISGIRKGRQDSGFRRTSGILTNVFLNVLSRSNIRDYGTMLRVFNKELAKTIAVRYQEERLYIPVLVNKITRNVHEVEVGHEIRFAGHSKYDFVKLIKTFSLIFLRYHSRLTVFLQKIHLMKQDGKLYEIKEKINFNI